MALVRDAIFNGFSSSAHRRFPCNPRFWELGFPSMSERPALSPPKRRLAILGSSGSIGRNTLEVIAASEGRLRAEVLSVHSNTRLLVEQAREFRPRRVVVTNPEANREPLADLPKETEVAYGEDALCEAACLDGIDMVVSAIVGIAGLRSTWEALRCGKLVALANKESLVVGGALMAEMAQSGSRSKNTENHKDRTLAGESIEGPHATPRLLPVDSEHSAVMQAMESGGREEVHRVILTASGGPFRSLSLKEIEGVTVEDALAHPTWNMGKKITIDSATLMNKALEIIEAKWLFDLAPEEIGVMIHPQSIVHSMVEYRDGSVLAQMSPPDMKMPIQYALEYPRRQPGCAKRLDWTESLSLTFLPPDGERFPAIGLGLEVARAGGTAGAVVNAANEAAVSAFLSHRIPFSEITNICQSILDKHHFEARPTLDRLFELDRWARKEVETWISRSSFLS
jgi:1-deoxy-D-xylulose-5-phosphate reductoisomerase